jgi:miniconductance mechanosensitive channel
MKEFFHHLYETWGLDAQWQHLFSWTAALVSVLALSYVLGWIIKGGIGGLIRRLAARTETAWDDYILDKKFFAWLGRLVPSVVAFFLLLAFVTPDDVVFPIARKVVLLWVCVTATGFLNQLVANFEHGFVEILAHRKVPVRSYTQVVRILLFLVSGILIVAELLDQNPVGILTGLGAATAVLLLVFRDSLLGLVASLQLNANNLVQIGDWIEVPGQNIDGEIIDIALSVVRVKSGDNTIYSMPTYNLISTTFKNWRNVNEAGARRLKISFPVDAQSLGTVSPADRERLVKVGLWKMPDGRDRVTNLEAFRFWAQDFLESHGDIHPQFARVVRLGDPAGRGLPVEMVFYTRLTGYPDWENLHSHLLAVMLTELPAFGLRVYQDTLARG